MLKINLTTVLYVIKASHWKEFLKRHLLIHTRKKPCKCSVCDAAFTRKHHLRRHLLTHSGEKPHRCNVCNQTFTQKHHLRRHLLIHTGDKPHKCDVCGKGFAGKTYLRHHLLLHSGEKTVQMQHMQQNIYTNKHLKESFTHTQWWKTSQV